VSTLPFSLRQKDGVVERHQLEGNDPSDRYFSRAILVSRIAQGYIGKATYEALTVEGQSHPTIIAATKMVSRFDQNFIGVLLAVPVCRL